MPFLLFIFLLFGSFISAQNIRVTYEYDLVQDTLNPEEKLIKEMSLDITKDGSLFYDKSKFESDSLAESSKSLASNAPSMPIVIRPNTFLWQVHKYFSKPYALFITTSSNISYQIKDDRKMSWEILPETKTILGYQVQKAIASFGGRSWIAWFTSEIPIAEGPYKFRGLPGLIMEIEDTSNSHHFIAKAIKKGSAISPEQYPTQRFWSAQKEISWENYKNIYRQQRAHPGEEEIGRIIADEAFRSPGETKLEAIRRIKDEYKNKYMHDNNPIEIDLLNDGK